MSLIAAIAVTEGVQPGSACGESEPRSDFHGQSNLRGHARVRTRCPLMVACPCALTVRLPVKGLMLSDIGAVAPYHTTSYSDT